MFFISKNDDWLNYDNNDNDKNWIENFYLFNRYCKIKKLRFKIE